MSDGWEKIAGIFEIREKQPRNRAKLGEFHEKINIVADKIDANSTICRYIEIWRTVQGIPHHSTADSSRLTTFPVLLALRLSKRPVEVPALADHTQGAWSEMNKHTMARARRRRLGSIAWHGKKQEFFTRAPKLCR